MKTQIIEYYDWTDKEWKLCPETLPSTDRDFIDREYKALKKGGYRKSKLRIVNQ